MKTAYFDTGVIAKWYVAEANSDAALALRSRFRTPVPLTPLHRLELAAAWHAKVHRGEIAIELAHAALDDLESDVAAGIFWTAPFDLVAAFAAAERLARRFGPTLGVRALDILHVALALEAGETSFVSADKRQASLATAAGMRVTALA